MSNAFATCVDKNYGTNKASMVILQLYNGSFTLAYAVPASQPLYIADVLTPSLVTLTGDHA